MRLPSGRIYLDFNATTPLEPEVADLLARTQSLVFGNPSSGHAEGREAREALESARKEVSAFAGCSPEEVVFTGSGTEANVLAMRSAALGRPGRNRVLVSAVEHPSVLEQRGWMEEAGLVVQEIPVEPSGGLDLEALRDLLGGDVAMVSVMTAHNETGVRMELEPAAALCAEHGALFHTDAVQAAGKVGLPWREARPHYMSLAAHKVYGPKGVGALVVRGGAPVRPVLAGGGQEGGRRASTESVPLCAAFGRACAMTSRWAGEGRDWGALRDWMEEELKSRFGAVVHGESRPRLPNTSFFSLPGADARAVARALDDAGFAVSSGSACHSGEAGIPRVLLRMGSPPGSSEGALRVSLGRRTETAHLELLLDALPAAIARAGA